MSSSTSRLAKLFLRYAAPLAGLRRLPVIGPCVKWASGKLISRDALVWVQVRQGPARKLWLRLNPRTGRNYFEGECEPEVQAALVQHLRPGMTFYDIGANIGFFSLLAARLVGKEGSVIAFEADPQVAERLRENITQNDFSSVTVEEKAVWKETTTISFVRADPNSSPDRGLGHVDMSPTAGNVLSVQAVSLDDFVSNSPAPDFLKCDVEGAEVEVFLGARHLLNQKRPGILCELYSRENQRILEEEFSRLGYSCRLCGENHLLAIPQ